MESTAVKEPVNWERQFLDLERENKKLREEFNNQRAKMKDIFLQKESECRKLTLENEELTRENNECKSRAMIIEIEKEKELQETESLKQFVMETLDESSSLKDNQIKLHVDYERIKQENFKLHEMLSQQQDSPSLAPVINHVKKFALKFGSDSNSSENLEDSMRKAQEDAEVLRSLVEPLEEEINALKEKLRTTDHELQKYLNNAKSSSTTVPDSLDNSTSDVRSPTPNPDCLSCKKFESEIALLKTSSQNMEMLTKQVTRLQEDLDRENLLRRELEKEWQVKREQHKEAVTCLADGLKKSEDSFSHLQKHYNELKDQINQELLQLTQERENLYRHVETVQRENEMLAGIYLKNSEELQNQEINLPSDVEELHELLLKANQSLIEARVGCEYEQTKGIGLRDEAQLLRHQLEQSYKDRNDGEKQAGARIRNLEEQRKEYEKRIRLLMTEKERYEKMEHDFKRESSELREQAIEMRAIIDKLEKINLELKSKVSTLQQDLANGETVQQDFVRLSQSLQMQLEKIRVADTQVRWQDDDDVDQCSNCKVAFTVTKRKQHCRHCGTIYCDKCVSKVVPSGSSKKPARVCDVCHTLLMRNTAPYFSSAIPQTP